MSLDVVVDHPQARSLPARHRFALARMIAYLRLLRKRPRAEPHEHLILAIDRDQTPAEMYVVAVWIFFTATCYIAAWLPFALPLSFAAAIPLAAIGLQIPIVGGGPLVRLMTGDGSNPKTVSMLTMVLVLLASSYIATTATWARFTAWFFFAVLITNSVAAIAVRMLRKSMKDAEERCVR